MAVASAREARVDSRSREPRVSCKLEKPEVSERRITISPSTKDDQLILEKGSALGASRGRLDGTGLDGTRPPHLP